VARYLSLQVLVNDLDEFLGREDLGRIAAGAWIDHVLTNVIFDDLSDEAVQRTPAGSGLLQDIRTLLICIDRPLNRFNLTAQSFDAIQKLHLFFRDVTHGLKPLA
jgi:hypothetical protein